MSQTTSQIMKSTIKILYILSPLLLVSLFSCRKDKAIEPYKINHYIHLSHTRTSTNPHMDSLVELIDYSKYDMLWLGGDLSYLTSLDNNTMTHIDSIFDIGNKKTLWALGNHYYTDINRIQQFTNRPAYYSTYHNKITLIILDTQDSLSNIVGSQRDFLIEILDTIQVSTHLIILHHKLIWMYNNNQIENLSSSIPNTGIGDCFHCINPNNFNSEIYPKLVDIKKKGIEILCIGGDIGFKSKEFQHLTPEGIYFIASGIGNGNKNNKALLFTHDITNNNLTWDFTLTSDLLKK